jgi:hypothetical protein
LAQLTLVVAANTRAGSNPISVERLALNESCNSPSAEVFPPKFDCYTISFKFDSNPTWLEHFR